MGEFHKLSEELDYLQKKVASLREIYKLYPDTTITKLSIYESASLNKNADVIRFSYDRGVLWAYTSKIFGCIEVHTKPNKFAALMYDPHSLFTHLIVQEYRENMKKNQIPEDLIKKTDLHVLEFIRNRHINIKNSNLDTLRNDDLKKLLVLT